MAEYIIDCDSKILGRLASKVAKMLLNGDSVVLVNAEKAVISGHADDIIKNYKQKVEFKDKANPEHSPYISRRPDLLVKRVIRGMLPFKKTKGKLAYKRLKVFMGLPKQYQSKQLYSLPVKTKKDVIEKSISILELSRKLGYNR
ncbi:MAG: 50S ribosomal protein L13 [Candidatus Micrarchaeia archaeon]|jgi:large subunit ribosomal protein L13